MKLALVISTLGAGGAERAAARLAAQWSAAGHDVTVITFSAGSFYEFPAPVKRLELTGAGGRIAGNLRRVLSLAGAVRGLKPDAVVSFMDQTNVTALLASFFFGAPVIVTEHADPRQYSPGRAWELLRRLLYPRAAAFVAVSRGALEGFPPALRRRGTVIYNPVDPPTAPAAGEARKVIGVGRLSREKGFDLLIEAFAAAAAENPGWELEIFGDGPERAALEAQIDRLGLRGRARLPGRTPDVYGELGRAGIFVLPSRFESFGIALCEAMACGLPVVSFDCPTGPAEIITAGEDGLLVKNGDAAALAAALGALMRDTGRRRALGGRAAQSAARYFTPAIAMQWELLLGDMTRR